MAARSLLVCLALVATTCALRAPAHVHTRPLLARPAWRTAAVTLSDSSGDAEEDSCRADEVSTLELFRFIVPTLGGWISSEALVTAAIRSLRHAGQHRS